MADISEKVKRLEQGLKSRAKRLNSKEQLSPNEESVLEEIITTLQFMQDIKLIDTWRWD